jgi:hypothetical protein
MEVREIVNYYINETLHTLEVTFKTNNDNDDELRVDQVDLNEAENFGFLFTKTNVEDLYEDLNLDEDVFDIDEDEDEEIEVEEVISFLNEYYAIYPERLPSVTIY